MPETFDVTVGVSATATINVDLPVSFFGSETETWVAALAIQPDASASPVAATYVVHDPTANQATVPTTAGSTQSAAPNATFDVTLVSLSNGLAIFRINHGTPISADDEETWQLDISHGGAVTTDFFVAVDHAQADVRVPRMSFIIGPDLDPPSPTLDFGRATFNATKTLSALVFNTGTGDFDLDTITLNDATGFYAITADPSGATVAPNGQEAVDIGYTPAPPPPAAPHTADLSLPSTTAGVDTIDVSITGEAVFREIVLCLDASNSMNWANDGTPLADCPVGSTLAANFDPDSRIRQVRAALESFRTKLIEYGEEQTLLGIVQFPGGDLACGSKHSDALAGDPDDWKSTVQSLTVFSGSDTAVSSNINAATEVGYYHSTPMEAGLQEAIGLFSGDPGDYRAIILLSDGKHNVPYEDPLTLLNAVLPDLTNVTRPIRVMAIGFGESESVDHGLLEDLAVQTNPLGDPTGFFAYNPTAGGNEEDLESFYTKIFVDLFELDQAVDPTAQIARGATNQHKVLVTALDHRVTFSIAWTTPRRELLSLALLAPNGDQITPKTPIARYYAGRTHKMYAVDIDQLGGDYVGEWTMIVGYRASGGDVPPVELTSEAVSSDVVETYSYDAIMRSGLHLSVQFDKERYHTGDRVVVMAQLTENGRPLLGQNVQVQVKRPDEGIGNWYADHSVPFETIEEALAGPFGPNSAASVEQISPVFKKQYYLTSVETVAVPAYTNAFSNAVDMHDDGQDGDVRGQDGVYTAVLDDLAIRPGVYSFTIVATGATGATGGGDAFRREQVIHFNVQTRIDTSLDFTQVVIESLGTEGGGPFGIGGLQQFRAYIRPEDHLGNIWGPGHAHEVVIESTGAHPIGPVIDDLEGGYYRDFEYDAFAGTPTVDFEVGGETIPPQVVRPDGRVGGSCLLLLLAFALLIALLIILVLILGF